MANSAYANAATGRKGIEDALEITRFASEKFSVKKNEVLLASTGVIGEYLPVGRIKKGIAEVKQNFDSGDCDPQGFAESILTTDTRKKEVSSDGFWACAKGSGMIAPDMATFLCFVLTDRYPRGGRIDGIFDETREVFNRISVDGETSTNDSVFLLSARRREISATEFEKELSKIFDRLSREILSDGEGATKIIDIVVSEAATVRQASRIAKYLADSPLIKTAFNGESPNWGRIFSRLGAGRFGLSAAKIGIKISGVAVFSGRMIKFDEAKLRRKLKKREIELAVSLGLGKGTYRYSTTDLSADYVKINAGYLT